MKKLVCCLVLAALLTGCNARQQEPKTLYQDSVISVSRERRKKNAVVEEKTLSKSDAVQITSSFNVIRIFETESGKTVCIRLE